MRLPKTLTQAFTLTRKDLTIVAWHKCFSTFLRALALPIAYMFFIAYCRNFFLPPSEYGIGSWNTIRNLTTEVFGSDTSLGGRNRVIFVNNGYTGGQIEQLIERLAVPLRDAGADVRILSDDEDLFEICESSLRGFSGCYAAATFRSSPTEGSGGVWSYTARVDGGLGYSPFVNSADNAAQIYALPFVNAIDAGIAALSGVDFPETMLEQPFTSGTRQDRADEIQEFFMRALSNYLAVAMFVGICGITYHLPGHLASERELGISSLIDAMLYAKHKGYAMLARQTSIYASFTAIYLPSWMAMGAIVSELMFTRTDASVVVPFHLLAGLALTGYSIFVASFFRRAQLSGTTTLILALVLAVIAQFIPRTATIIGVLSCLFPPVAYTSYQIQLANWERILLPADIETSSPLTDYELPGYVFFVFLAVQIVVYPLLAALVQWVLYGTASQSRKSLPHHETTSVLNVVNISKLFRPSIWRTLFLREGPVKAVQNLSFSLVQGNITALLGANGSGKSTTLAAIAGTQTVSSGHIEADASIGLGFCPQHNVMWDELSVLEHVRIFQRLKAPRQRSNDTPLHELIYACDLEGKVNKKSKTLSGGQKRKLQLAMAFVGDSRLCCIDEVSSGLDPLSRRKIWDILLSHRGERALLLTTHALDEADALADEIAIMSKGELVVHGTAPDLKERHGGGYRVVTSDSKAETIAEERNSYEENGDIVLAAHDSSDACRLAKKLQSAGIDDLYIRGPTIEDVFIGVARELAEEMHGLQPDSPSANGRQSTPTSGQIEKTVSDSDTDKQSLDLVAGKGTTFPQQVWILWRKRLLIFTRNWLPFLCAIIIPIITAGLTTMFLGGFDRLECSRSAQFNSPQVVTLGALEVYWGILVPAGPAQQFDLTQLPATYQQFSDRIQVQSSFSGYQDYIANNFRDVVPGGFYLDVDIPEAAGQAPLMSYRLNDGLGYAAIAKTLIDQYLTGTTINAEFSTFALPFVGSTGDSLQLVLYITLAMCAYSGFFALYPTFERLANIRNLHYSNGIRPAPLWLAYWLFDGGFAVVVAVVSVAMFGSLSDVWYAPSYLCVVFFLFGLSSIFLAYLVSLFCRSQLAAFAFVAGGQAICALIYFLLYLVILTFAAAESLQQNLNVLQFTFGLITPSGNVLRSLLIALNESQIVCRDQGYFSYPGDIEAYGCPILYLVLQTLVFYGSLVWHDSGWSILTILNRRKRGKDTNDDEKDISTLPPDVQAEIFRAEQSKDQLKTLHLEKEFGHDRVVDDVTFGVDGSEVLALLGPNGAGKTTTLSMIRGDLHPSSLRSDVLICNTSALHNRLATRQMLGVCPQFNTMDYMTVTEHLSFYARVRGVPDVSSNVLKVIDAVGLSSYRHRMAGKLSGGNQRKLSLATSIIGNPAVLLLDEPSTGMDAVAMRVMWKAIRAIAACRAIVLTTHSMEEASALSSRTAILDRRLLALQGTRELVTKYSQGLLHVHVVLESGAKASAAEMQTVREWITTRFPGAEADDERGSGRRGQLRFRIPPDAFEMHRKPHAELSSSGGSRMVKVIDMLESSKREIGISAYSVSHATLEDVFLDIVSRNREW
ncbi:hypothetical protein D0863_00083 [Hortaea werneckii]|uniref:ABC transporter domain-containing protein n=1 Tax=Hortaea werneckii TaxID=91943 RepID=A0A3M7ESQ1_HORWE|nr:hypothetical protein D0863_00083 [Hortaea werneckii]